MKLYGSLNNRFDENHYFDNTYNNLKVGTPCTIYHWSDRHAYEVIDVQDQEHITIRRLKSTRTDNYGMSDSQNYKYESNPKGETMELVLKNGNWRKVERYNNEKLEKAKNVAIGDLKMPEAATRIAIARFRQELTEKQLEKVLAGKEVTKLGEKVNISFGVADEYHDYSF